MSDGDGDPRPHARRGGHRGGRAHRAASARRAARPARRRRARCAVRGETTCPIGVGGVGDVPDPGRGRGLTRRPRGDAVRRGPGLPRRRHRVRRARGRGGCRRGDRRAGRARDAAAAGRGERQPGHRSPTRPRWWYGDPSRRLGVVGITGTDGKTTTSFLAVAALEAAGISTGLVGTVETKVGDRARAARGPRHDARRAGAPGDARGDGRVRQRGGGPRDDVPRARARPRARGGVRRGDLHQPQPRAPRPARLVRGVSRGEAAAVRRRSPSATANPAKTVGGKPWPKLAVINRDDPASSWFEATAREAGATVLTYGQDARGGRAPDAHRGRRPAPPHRVCRPVGRGVARAPARGPVQRPQRARRRGARRRPRAGRRSAVRAGLEAVEGVPGRMERIDRGQPFGGDRRLRALAGVARRRPRPARAASPPPGAARWSPCSARAGSATPRSAPRWAGSPASGAASSWPPTRTRAARTATAIVDEIVRGAESAGRHRGVDVLAIPDRRAAIEAAFERARPGDVVLLAGKGHEPTILYADHALPWDEAAVARETLAAHGLGRLMRGCLFTLAFGAAVDRPHRRRRAAPGRRRHGHDRGHRRGPPGRRHDRHRLERPAHGPRSGSTPTGCASGRPTRRSATSRSARSTSCCTTSRSSTARRAASRAA